MTSIEIETEFEFDVFPKRGITVVRGRGSTVWDEDGKQYIDCVSGNGTAFLGHCNSQIIEAINVQADRLITCPGIFYNDIRAQLLKKLVGSSPRSIKKAFLCNSGTESVEAAIKFARYSTGKTDFVCAMRGFHGRTFGSMSATYNPRYKDSFRPVVPGFSFVPYNNFGRLAESVMENTAGILLEVVQGEGGVIIGGESYFQQVQDICRQKDILLIIDEVQTGLGRTGKLFACEHYDLEPDIICIAKPLGGGLPIGATLCSDRIHVPLGLHGTTFGGNPLCCAAALAALNFIEEHDIPKIAAEKGNYLKHKIKSLSKIREIRQIGLMIGIELKEKVKPFISALLDKGILVLPAGPTVLRLLPPAVISYAELGLVCEKINSVLC